MHSHTPGLEPHTPEARRARRRRLTLQVARRRRAVHLAQVHPDGALDCACEAADTFFAKCPSVGCDCRSRPKGSPKYRRSPCHGGLREPVRTRIDAGRALRAVRDGRLDPDEVPRPRGRFGWMR